MKVFLDANVLFSAALAGSRMAAFLRILQQQGECVTSAFAIDEARRNLSHKAPDALKVFDELSRSLRITNRVADVSGVALKDKDRPILGAAVAAHCTHLLTGDARDFGFLFGKRVAGVRVATAKILAEELARAGALKKRCTE